MSLNKDIYPVKKGLDIQNKFVHDLLSIKNKYRLPVIMGVCTFNEVKNFTYQELIEIRKIAIIKLEKELIEHSLSLLTTRL